LRIAVVAGESSGDILGAGLIRALKRRFPEACFEGIGGPLMQEAGLHSIYPMERLSVMGLVEVLGRLRELIGIRRSLRERWLQAPPDLFVGIDAPDFNLSLERALRQGGIPTCHYVSPSVWAWRKRRIKKIARSTDLMLCLFPFEARFYAEAGIDARFVGHTLADELPIEPDTLAARVALNLPEKQRVVALLPGSRGGEVQRLAPLFIEAARQCLRQLPDLHFVIPAASESRYEELQLLLEAAPDLSVELVRGRSREVMASADVILMASGTAALEGLLLKKPMVVAYRMSPLTYAILSRMIKVPYVSLPNLLAGEALVPELLQEQATPKALVQALMEQLDQPERLDKLKRRFSEIHQQLRCNASEQAADAVASLLLNSRR
jgi:lipid-A-disaccharide synthase